MTKHFILAAVGAVCILGGHSTAIAQERFSLTLKDGAVVRLDQRTGAVSLCQTKAGGITCSMAADERAAWNAEIEVMADRIDLLEKRLAAVEALSEGSTPGSSSVEKQPSAKDGAIASKQSEEDRRFDRAMEKAETFMRRMIGVIKELKDDVTAQ